MSEDRYIKLFTEEEREAFDEFLEKLLEEDTDA